MNVKEQFPGICRATLSMSYDNGGINRDRSEEQCLKSLDEYLAEHWLSADNVGIRSLLYAQLSSIDYWFVNLPDDKLDEVCNGEEDSIKAILAAIDVPHGVEDLLNGIFEYVA